jgi:hypothetical protein
MLTICFRDVSLIIVNTLSYGVSFTQKYFINTILPDIVKARERIFRRVRKREFFMHMDNSICHNDRKVTNELAILKLDRVPDPPHSPYLSPCDFLLFEYWGKKIKDGVSQTVDEIMTLFDRV